MFRITPPDIHAMREAKRLLDGFIKPPGSLGTLEEIAIRLAGITGHARSTLKRKVITLFGSDHGVYSEGVCSSPQDFTAGLMRVYAGRQDGGINILARQAGAELRLYDLGIKNFTPHPNVISHRFMNEGTHNFLHGRAMPPDLAQRVIITALTSWLCLSIVLSNCICISP